MKFEIVYKWTELKPSMVDGNELITNQERTFPIIKKLFFIKNLTNNNKTLFVCAWACASGCGYVCVCNELKITQIDRSKIEKKRGRKIFIFLFKATSALFFGRFFRILFRFETISRTKTEEREEEGETEFLT